jgi:hypothetical protein
MRSTLTALVVVGSVLGQTCLADEIVGAKHGDDPILYFHADAADPAYGSVDLTNLTTGMVAKLRGADPPIAQWPLLFSVSSELCQMSECGALPPVSGRYELLADRVRFTPRFPPVQGLNYRARADLLTLLGSLASPNSITLSFSLPEKTASASTVVDGIFPSGNVLPENLLRLYVHFSAPMQRGHAWQQVALLGADGQPVPAVFYNTPTELWDPAMQRLTILLDPGRIKRNVGPNIVLGPPLQQGSRYTLLVGAGMIDANDQPLRETFSTSFSVGPANREPINPRQWTLSLPRSGTRQPLSVSFPGPLDRALMSRGITVVGAGQMPVAGNISVEQFETRWIFTPTTPWVPAVYRIVIEGSLEDVSGNTTQAPFDASAHERTAWPRVAKLTSLPFALCPGVVHHSALPNGHQRVARSCLLCANNDQTATQH